MRLTGGEKAGLTLPLSGLFHEPQHQVAPIQGAGFDKNLLDVAAHGPEGNPQLPGNFLVRITGQDAPVLFVVSGGQNRIVNYRMKNDMMIVDYNIDKAVLVSGVGWRQQKITIRRGG